LEKPGPPHRTCAISSTISDLADSAVEFPLSKALAVHGEGIFFFGLYSMGDSPSDLQQYVKVFNTSGLPTSRSITIIWE